jgi:hypothetical protein
VTLFVSFPLFHGDKDNRTIFFVCVQNGWAGGHRRKFYGRNHDLVDRYGISVSQTLTGPFLAHDLSKYTR